MDEKAGEPNEHAAGLIARVIQYHRNNWPQHFHQPALWTSPPYCTLRHGTATWRKHKWMRMNLLSSLTNCHTKVLRQVQLVKLAGGGSGGESGSFWLWNWRLGPSFRKDSPSERFTQNIIQSNGLVLGSRTCDKCPLHLYWGVTKCWMCPRSFT